MSQSTYAVAKARYAGARDQARRQAAVNLGEAIGVGFYLGDWTRKAQEAFVDQWGPVTTRPHEEGGWDWFELFNRYRAIDMMPVAIWTPEDRLSGLGLVTTSNPAATVRFVEGDPRPDCPLHGKRALIVIEAAACYAQVLGKREVRLEPANEKLTELYRDVYGFTLESPRKGASYYRKEV